MDSEATKAALVFSNLAEKNAVKKSKDYTDAVIATLPHGITYKGEVNYFADLPSSGQEVGDCYTVKYRGTTGAEPDGTEYVWGEYESTLQWIPFGPENAVSYTAQTGKTDAEKAQARENIEAEHKHPYVSLRRLGSYLYEATYKTLAPELDIDPPQGGMCSSYVKDGKLYTNLDWGFSDAASFHIICPGFEGTAFLKGLTDTELDDTLIGQLPYHIRDGKNEHGIMVATHILYNDWEAHGSGSIPLTKLPYIALTRIKSMATIISDLTGVLDNLHTTPALDAAEYLIQVLVSDGTTTYVLRPGDSSAGTYEAVNITAVPKLTNFRWVNNATVSRGNLQDRPTGVERWNAMPAALSDLRFTKAYEAPTRLSEFIGINGTDKDSSDAELAAIYNTAHAMYEERTRDGETWQTMHSVVYSPVKMEHLWVQEDWTHDFVGVDIPTKLSDLDSDADHRTVTDTEKETWNNKSDFSGRYNDLTGKPTIPSKLSDLTDDATHRTVSDNEKNTWGGKADRAQNATANNIALLDAEGNPIDSGHKLSDFVAAGAISVSISDKLGTVPVAADNLKVQLLTNDEIMAEAVYDTQAVTFGGLTPGIAYTVKPVGTWDGRYKPTPATYEFTAEAGTTKSVAILYSSMSVPESLAELADIVQNGGAKNIPIGTTFDIPWTDTATNTQYTVPVDVVAIKDVEDENGVTHEAAIIQWHYCTPFTVQFDAAEQVKATEETAQEGLTYYGVSGSTYSILALSTGDTIPYSSYDNVYKNAIRDTSFNLLKYGYNRYRDSAWRQLLNSDAGKGEWWTATHVGDVAPSQLSSRAGFMSGFSAADKALMKKSKITCFTNSVTDGSVIDTMYDTWYLPSGTEMYGSVNANEGEYFPFWKAATGLSSPSNSANEGRIPYKLDSHTTAQTCWLRSANRSNSNYPWNCVSPGNISNNNAYYAYAGLPACAIY